MNTISGFGNWVGRLSGSAKTRQRRKGASARWYRNSNIFWGTRDNLGGKIVDVNALSFVLVRSGDDLRGRLVYFFRGS